MELKCKSTFRVKHVSIEVVNFNAQFYYLAIKVFLAVHLRVLLRCEYPSIHVKIVIAANANIKHN